MAIQTYLDRETEKRKQGFQPTLQAQPNLTDAGNLYQQRVTQGLTKPSPIVNQAIGMTDTDISRRNYLTRKQSQEDIAQSPFGAGTAQATRLMDQSRAGANMANMQQRQQLGGFISGENQQNLERARGIETDAYTRALGERTNDQIERGRYSSLIEDPRARYAYNRMVASGVQPSQAYQNVVGDTGTIQEQYQGLSPVGTLQRDATEWVKTVTDLQEGTPEFQQAVRDRLIAIDEAQQEPLSDATTERQKQDIIEKARTGEDLTTEEEKLAVQTGVIPESDIQTIPKGENNVRKFIEENPIKKVNIGGEVFEVVRGGSQTTSYKAAGAKWSPRHTDWVEVKTPKGQTKYIWDGQIHDNPPSPATKPGENIRRKLNPVNWF